MKTTCHFLFFLALFFATSSAIAQAPASPSNGAANIISRTQLEISWQDNSDNEDVFAVFVYPDAFTIPNPFDALVGEVQPDLTSGIVGQSFADGSRVPLTGGMKVQYAIFAYNVQSGFSESYALTPEVRMPDEIIRFGHQATIGQSFSAELYTDDSNLQDSASVSGLPDWATFDKATRTVSGTPDAEGIHLLNLNVDYSDGFNITETAPIRVLPATAGPILSTELPSPKYWLSAESQSIDLNAYFADPDCSRAVRMTLNVGTVDIILYENATPATVSNFLAYASKDPNTGQNRYDGSMVHRSISGFIIQGGGYRLNGGNSFVSVPDFEPVVNEPGLENVRGTLSMAKLNGDPDSATSEWFINLGDNRPNLDFQNGGFTVFARVAGNGMDVVDEIAALPTGNYSTITVDGIPRSRLLSDCPMNVDTATAPASMQQDKLVVIESVVEVDPLKYSIVSNSDASVAEATLSNGTLQITPLKSGTCTLKVRATDLDNNQIDRDIAIEIAGWTFEDWVEAQGLADEQKDLLDDADGDSLTNFIEYALFGDSANPTHSLTKLQKVSFGTTVAQDYPAIKFSTRNNIKDTLVCVEATDQLSSDTTWTEIWNSSQGSSGAQVQSVDVKTDHTDWVIRDTKSTSLIESRFMRVRVERIDSQ